MASPTTTKRTHASARELRSKRQWIQAVTALVGDEQLESEADDISIHSPSLTERLFADRALLDRAFSDSFTDSELLQD
jgi:hypothetical protein